MEHKATLNITLKLPFDVHNTVDIKRVLHDAERAEPNSQSF